MESIYINGKPDHIRLHTDALQVRMFVHTDVKEAEKAIGLWLKQHDVIIHHLTQSQSEKGGKFVFVLSVFYREAM